MIAPPSICPSTSVGLIARPTSYTCTIFSTTTSPVSSSTSTSATHAAYEIAECGSISTWPVASSTSANGLSAVDEPLISSP